VVVFKSLTTGQIRQIVDLQLQRLGKRLIELQITITVTDAAKDLLAREGYDRIYGARPLRRVITSRIEDQLSEELLCGRISRGDVVMVDVSAGGVFTFHSEPRWKATASEDFRAPSGTLA